MKSNLQGFKHLFAGGTYRHTQLAGGTFRYVSEVRIDGIRLVSALLLITGSLLAIQNYLYNQEVIREADVAVQAAYNSSTGGEEDVGAQAATVIPSTNEPSREEVLAYTVPPHLPKRIEIPAIDVFARITVVGDNVEGEVGVPENVFNSSWYENSSPVGSEPGSAVIVGHVGFRSINGVFHDIGRLAPGEIITVVMGDDRRFTYQIRANQETDLAEFSMSDYLSYRNEPNGLLHIMTCSGGIIPGTFDYDSRTVVSAVLVDES